MENERGGNLYARKLAGSWCLLHPRFQRRRFWLFTRHSATLDRILTTDTLVNPAEPFHFSRIKKIATIKQDRMRQPLLGAGKVELLELIPFRRDHQRVAAFSHGIHIV